MVIDAIKARKNAFIVKPFTRGRIQEAEIRFITIQKILE